MKLTTSTSAMILGFCAMVQGLPAASSESPLVAVRTSEAEPVFWQAPFDVLDGEKDTSAAPAARDNDDQTKALVVRDRINDCDDSTFVNQSSGGSPRVDDCRQLTYNIQGGGSWRITDRERFRTLATYGTCAFGAEAITLENWYFYVGNQDIIDLINDSINRFQWNGLVGAKGEMHCQGGDMSGKQVSWALFHT